MGQGRPAKSRLLEGDVSTPTGGRCAHTCRQQLTRCCEDSAQGAALPAPESFLQGRDEFPGNKPGNKADSVCWRSPVGGAGLGAGAELGGPLTRTRAQEALEEDPRKTPGEGSGAPGTHSLGALLMELDSGREGLGEREAGRRAGGLVSVADLRPPGLECG